MDIHEIRKLSDISFEDWKKVRYKDGHYRTKAPFDLEMRTKNILDIKRVLDSVGLKFWLTNGTALAARREGDWIKWDDDVDLDVMMEDFLPKHDEIRELFISEGFIFRTRHLHNSTSAKVSMFRGGEKTALRPLYLDKNYYNNKYRLRHAYKYPRKFYESSETIEFMGETFNIPSPSKEFMEWCYGKNWKTPLNSDDESVYSPSQIKR